MHCLIIINERSDKERITSEVLAKETGHNPVVIRTVTGALKKEGILSIPRGTGGASLAKPLDKITFYDVFKTVDPQGLSNFLGAENYPSDKCPISHFICQLLTPPYLEIKQAMIDKMKEITLESIIKEKENNEDKE